MTARELWDKGKVCETFGPWFVTRDKVKDPQSLSMWLDVNGEKRQRGNTRTIIFNCEYSSGTARSSS